MSAGDGRAVEDIATRCSILMKEQVLGGWGGRVWAVPVLHEDNGEEDVQRCAGDFL